MVRCSFLKIMGFACQWTAPAATNHYYVLLLLLAQLHKDGLLAIAVKACNHDLRAFSQI